MKNNVKIPVLLSVCALALILLGTYALVLAAHGQFTQPNTLPTATDIDTAVPQTSAVALTRIQVTETADAAAVWPVMPRPTRTPTPSPSGPPYPTLNPTEIPGLLQRALVVEPPTPFNGHAIQRITGWTNGFHGVDWLDANHLSVHPIVGLMSIPSERMAPKTDAAVLNLRSKKFWIPFPGHTGPHDGGTALLLPLWSAQLGVMIAFPSENSTGIYSPDGVLISSYTGTLQDISPSVTKLLMADGTWIDLASGKMVKFTWKPPADKVYENTDVVSPKWSADETRVYTCCCHYGDARTGASLDMPSNHIKLDGKELDNFDFFNMYGTWMLGGKYMLSQWNGVFDDKIGFVPLFDPAAKTYINLNARLGIPYSLTTVGATYCNRADASPDGRYVWMRCADSSYLVDLATFASHAYPNFVLTDIEWSPDGKFALVTGTDQYFSQVPRKIVSVASGELKPAPDCSYDWAEDGHLLYCYDQQLTFVDAKTLTVQAQADLPADIWSVGWSLDGKRLMLWTKDKSLWQIDYPGLGNLKKTDYPAGYQLINWSPDGNHLALKAQDNSLWLIDYPTFDHLEQLTPAMPGSIHDPGYLPDRTVARVRNVTWSPDGASLAFVGDMDVYIVDVKSRP